MKIPIKLVLSDVLRHLASGDDPSKIWPLLANGRMEVYSGAPPPYAGEVPGFNTRMAAGRLEDFKACCPVMISGTACWARVYGVFGHADVQLDEMFLVSGDTITLDFSEHKS